MEYLQYKFPILAKARIIRNCYQNVLEFGLFEPSNGKNLHSDSNRIIPDAMMTLLINETSLTGVSEARTCLSMGKNQSDYFLI